MTPRESALRSEGGPVLCSAWQRRVVSSSRVTPYTELSNQKEPYRTSKGARPIEQAKTSRNIREQEREHREHQERLSKRRHRETSEKSRDQGTGARTSRTIEQAKTSSSVERDIRQAGERYVRGDGACARQRQREHHKQVHRVEARDDEHQSH